MEAHIFAEGSSTTADDNNLPIKEYYQGLFGMVSGLNDELEEYIDTELYILSEEYGVINGYECMSDIQESQNEPVGDDKTVSIAKDELLRVAENADVMVILLSTDIFRSTVTEIWDELVAAARPNSIWCFGAARSALNELNFENLEAKDCSVLTYQRVGVARIGSDTRDELLERVKQKAGQ